MIRTMKEVIFLNGRFILPEDAHLSVLTPGFLTGFGLFETMRAFQGRIVYFRQHLKRLQRSCRLLEMEFPYSLSKFQETIRKAVGLSGLLDAYVRLTLTKSQKETDVLLIVRPYQGYPGFWYEKGLRACVSRLQQNAEPYLSQLKTTNRIFYELAYSEARSRGFAEAIILNHRGYLSEASRSNLFFIKDNVIFTPELACGCLPGITRQLILDLAKKYRLCAEEGRFTLEDLCAAEEACLTNSLMGIMPLASVGKRCIGRGLAGRLTRFFMKKYNACLNNGI